MSRAVNRTCSLLMELVTSAVPSEAFADALWTACCCHGACCVTVMDLPIIEYGCASHAFKALRTSSPILRCTGAQVMDKEPSW